MFYDDKLINVLLQEDKASGGAAVQAYGWIRGLVDNGHDVCIFTSAKGNDLLKEDCRELTILPLYDEAKGIRWLRWLYYRLPYIYRKIKQTRPDYIYQGVPGWQSFLVGIICIPLKVKYILRISNDFLLDERIYKKHSIAFRYFLRLGMKLSYCIVCQNDYQYNIIKNDFPDKKAIKIHNPIFLRNNENPGGFQSRQYIAWIGLFQYQKNLALLYTIACLLKNELFFVAGEAKEKCDEETRTFLEKLKQLPNVKFVGFLHRGQILPFLSKAKFLLNTSHYEGFSNTFLEAMSVGTPIITSSKVNPDSIISKFHLGIVYTNPADLMDQYLLMTQESYRELSENCFNYVSENHNYKLLAEKLVQSLSA